MTHKAVFKISKGGDNVHTTEDKNLRLTNQKNTFKMLRTGRIDISLPQETLTYINTPVFTSHTGSYNHGLNYVPFYLPQANFLYYSGSGDFYVNDKSNEGPFFSYSPGLWVREYCQIYVTKTQLVLLVRREFNYSPTPPTSATFGARHYIVDYTVFHNQMDKEFNLL